jgi:hypothetical protein
MVNSAVGKRVVGNRATSSQTDISLHEFVDQDQDVQGWYSFGHHDAEEFLQSIVRLEPHAIFSTDEVRLSWAIFQDATFEVVGLPIEGAQPLTLVGDRGHLLPRTAQRAA